MNVGIIDVTLDDAIKLVENASGVGKGVLYILYHYYGEENQQIINIDDRDIKKGISILYKIDKPSKKQMKDIVRKISNKRIGDMMLRNIAHMY